MKSEVRKNEERNGIEVKFAERPSQEIIDWLKNHRFRWSSRQYLWWTRFDEHLINAVREYLDIVQTDTEPEVKNNNVCHNTPTDGLEVGHAVDLHGNDIADSWMVYHTLTGKTVSLRFDNKRLATRVRHELLKLANWTLEPSELKAQYPELEAEVIKTNKDAFLKGCVEDVPVEPLPAPKVVSIPVKDLPELQPPQENSKVIPITNKMTLMDRARRVLAAYGEDG
jgi:hypothetical protein